MGGDPVNYVDPDGLSPYRAILPGGGQFYVPFHAARVSHLSQQIQRYNPGFSYQSIRPQRGPGSTYNQSDVRELEAILRNEQSAGSCSRDGGVAANSARGVTNPGIAKLGRPSIPEGMTQSQFGKDVIGWGARPEGALQRMGSITRFDVTRMQSQGLTREMATQWRDFYSNEFSRNANNLTARNRVELMQQILNNFD